MARAPVKLADFADAALRRRWMDEKHMQVLWSRERRGFEVDLFVAEPFDFDAVFARAMQLRLDGGDIAVIAVATSLRSNASQAVPATWKTSPPSRR